MCVLLHLFSALVDDRKDGLLLLLADPHPSERLSDTAVWADRCPVILAGDRRVAVIGFSALGADSDPDNIVSLHFATSTL